MVVILQDRPAAFHIRRNDLEPPYEVEVSDAVTGDPIDLSAATAAAFTMRANDGTLKIDSAAAAVVVGSDGTTQSRLRYNWGAGDTDTPGRYVAEFQLTFAGTPVRPRTFPADPEKQKLEIVIHDDYDNA